MEPGCAFVQPFIFSKKKQIVETKKLNKEVDRKNHFIDSLHKTFLNRKKDDLHIYNIKWNRPLKIIINIIAFACLSIILFCIS